MATKRPLTFTECLEANKLKQRAKYEAEFGKMARPAGSAAWEVDETSGRYICHVSKCIFSTPFQIITAMKDSRWASDFEASGLVMDDNLLARMQTAAEAQKLQHKAMTQQQTTQSMMKRVRHFANTLCIVAKKTAESCLAESGKWPKNLERLGEHCNSLIPTMQGFDASLPEVVHMQHLHSLSCTLIQQIHSGDVAWPDTANVMLTTIAELEVMLKSSAAADAAAVPVVAEFVEDRKKAQKARNRAQGYIFRFKKLLKKCLPMCIGSAPGWADKLVELQGVLAEIAEKHTDTDPSCEEQKWLDRLMAESHSLCETALSDDPAWQTIAQKLLETLAEVEQAVPNPPPPPPQVIIPVPVAAPKLLTVPRGVVPAVPAAAPVVVAAPRPVARPYVPARPSFGYAGQALAPGAGRPTAMSAMGGYPMGANPMSGYPIPKRARLF